MSIVSLADEFQMLRVQLEPALPKPAIVVVTSARDGDGKHLAARGLAASFNAVSDRTLLVYSDAVGPKIAGAIGPRSLTEIDSGLRRFTFKAPDEGLDCITLSGDELRRGASIDSVAALCTSLRSRYRYTIVDATTFLDDSLALLLAVAADGVLLTVREGRRVKAEDRQLADTLDRAGAKLLGVVSVSSATIRVDTAKTAIREAVYARSTNTGGQVEKGLQQTERQSV